jgi:hypothetical protein
VNGARSDQINVTVGGLDNNDQLLTDAFTGPDTPASGERRKIAPVTQSQIAVTVVAFLGKNFPEAVPAAAGKLPDVVGGR